MLARYCCNEHLHDLSCHPLVSITAVGPDINDKCISDTVREQTTIGNMLRAVSRELYALHLRTEQRGDA